jgi:hypothetical protein
MSTLADTLELFFGDANPAETRVYARVRWSPGFSLTTSSLKAGLQPLRLAGQLMGPYCRYAQTLPATIPLVDMGPGETLLGQAIVPDPCFWTPELPFLYRARIELRHGGETLDAVEQSLGIRPLGGRGRRFYYEGRPWVLRGVHSEHGRLSELAAFREADAAMFIDDPPNDLCAAASEQGVLLVARVSGEGQTVLENIRRLARHAAVGLIVLPDGLPAGFDPRPTARNVVFVGRLDPAHRQSPPWAGAMLCEVASVDRFRELDIGGSLPLIACRRAAPEATIAQRRGSCDALQRDLAGMSEIAGYVV